MPPQEINCRRVTVDGYSVHYREATGDGQGPPVLLIHGWPTSSFLWRNIMPAIAEHRRVLAIDLPGLGESDKPLDITYDLEFYKNIIDGFLEAVGAGDKVALGVHDMGGPIGLYWASQRSDRLERLAVLNTLLYPELSWAVRAFLFGIKIPGLGALASSRWGLSMSMRVGVDDSSRLRPDTIEGVCAPFPDRASRRALVQTIRQLPLSGLDVIAEWLPTVTTPVKAVYGANDRILPRIEQTVERLCEDVPQTEVVRIDDCGHFLQEDRPEIVAKALAEFFSSPTGH